MFLFTVFVHQTINEQTQAPSHPPWHTAAPFIWYKFPGVDDTRGNSVSDISKNTSDAVADDYMPTVKQVIIVLYNTVNNSYLSAV